MFLFHGCASTRARPEDQPVKPAADQLSFGSFDRAAARRKASAFCRSEWRDREGRGTGVSGSRQRDRSADEDTGRSKAACKNGEQSGKGRSMDEKRLREWPQWTPRSETETDRHPQTEPHRPSAPHIAAPLVGRPTSTTVEKVPIVRVELTR